MLSRIFLLSILVAINPARSEESWIPLKTDANQYELDVNSLRYIDDKSIYIDVKYKLLIKGSDKRYSIIRSAVTCADRVDEEQYLWELFNADGDKINVKRTHRSAQAASKILSRSNDTIQGITQANAICQYVWKNESNIPKLKTASKNFSIEGANTAPVKIGSKKHSDVLTVNIKPLPFTYKMPKGWVEGMIVSGNTKASISSPNGKPEANCSVLTMEINGERDTQKNINQRMRIKPEKSDIEIDLARNWRNVKVVSVGLSQLMGYPAHNFIYQHGDASTGWAYVSTTTTVIAPNIIVAVSCGGTGKNVNQAKSAFDYWRMELNVFPTSLQTLGSR